TLGRILLLLIPPSSGEVLCDGENLASKKKPELARFRKRLQIIPQHPEDAFNPGWKVRRSILEPYAIHPDLTPGNMKNERLLDLLKRTGLNPDYVNRYPHQLSGGELQRAAIARTLALEPEFIVCDEPTSMLDVSVQASIIHLLKEIQQSTGITYLFITHDIMLARIMGDRVGVMHNGRIVEEGPGILDTALHPYTRALRDNTIRGDHHGEKTGGESHSHGCLWSPVCAYADDACTVLPPLRAYNGIRIRCHHPDLLQQA
ncbi:MAG: ATP-binding cassette domain-containing protein, partial [Methanospirillum sp.]|nr:ATP-binding cassette domain-containing protein [Methanospirillum sp.]